MFINIGIDETGKPYVSIEKGNSCRVLLRNLQSNTLASKLAQKT